MDLTYKIIGADGKEYGPVALAELQKWVGEGRITGATQVSRSDQPSWSTAASFPELGVGNSTGPGPVAAPRAADPVLEKQLKGGGSWFYWIADFRWSTPRSRFPAAERDSSWDWE